MARNHKPIKHQGRSCERKRRHLTKALAMLAMDSTPGAENVYRCRSCSEWHITSQEHLVIPGNKGRRW